MSHSQNRKTKKPSVTDVAGSIATAGRETTPKAQGPRGVINQQPTSPKPHTSAAGRVKPTPLNGFCGFCCEAVSDHPKKFEGNGIQCGLCCLWFHAGCTRLDEQAFTFLAENQHPGIHWFCNPCEVISKPVLGKITQIEKRLDNIEAKLEKHDDNTCKAHQNPHAINDIVKEISDREAKSRNLIIFGIPEENPGTVLDPLIANLDITPTDEPIRLGKTPETGKNRPILIRLDNETTKHHALATAKKLRASNKLPSGVTIKPDRTLMQRQSDRELRK
jgi:hypothetical protein